MEVIYNFIIFTRCQNNLFYIFCLTYSKNCLNYSHRFHLMGTHKNVKLYTTSKLVGSGREFPKVVLKSDDYGYWKYPTELLSFFYYKVGDENWVKWNSYDEEMELKIEDCEEFYELITEASRLLIDIMDNRYGDFDESNPDHVIVYNKIAEMFHFEGSDLKPNSHTISHVFDEHDYFTDLIEMIKKLDGEKKTYFVTLIFE